MPNRHESWKTFQKWLSEPLGQALLDLESKRLEKRIENLFGYHFLLLGEPQFLKTIKSTPIQHRVWVHPYALNIVNDTVNEANEHKNVSEHKKENEDKVVPEFNGSPLACRQDKLALLTDEIDLVLLAHCLENIQNPHEVLREAHRVLKPEGYIFLLGFNPWSIWGLWRRVVRYIKRVPWDGQFISISRLKDWLALLGFDIIHTEKYFFRFPFSNANFIRKTRWIEWLGRFIFSPFGACYLIQAKKRVITLTPIRPAWQKKKRFISSGVVEPAIRG